VALVALAQLSSLLVGIVYHRINAGTTAFIVAELKNRVYEALQRLSLGFFTHRQTGSLMTRVNYDAGNLQYFFHDGLPLLIVNAVQITGILAVMFSLDWRLTLLLLVPVPVLLALTRRAYPHLWRLFTLRHRRSASLTALVNDVLTGARVVKAFGREEQEIGRFHRKSDDLFQVTLAAGR